MHSPNNSQIYRRSQLVYHGYIVNFTIFFKLWFVEVGQTISFSHQSQYCVPVSTLLLFDFLHFSWTLVFQNEHLLLKCYFPCITVIQFNGLLQMWSDGQTVQLHGREQTPCYCMQCRSQICLIITQPAPGLWWTHFQHNGNMTSLSLRIYTRRIFNRGGATSISHIMISHSLGYRVVDGGGVRGQPQLVYREINKSSCAWGRARSWWHGATHLLKPFDASGTV